MTGQLLAIDPGNTHSGWTLVDVRSRQPLAFGKTPNGDLLDVVLDLLVGQDPDWTSPLSRVAIEMVASYGMPVGREVFETCVWIGRYQQLVDVYAPDMPCDLVYRRDVKLHHCGSARAKDGNVTQALVDRFTPGQPNYGKGTKNQPGWFHGFAGDVWQAYALAVYTADTTTVDSGALV